MALLFRRLANGVRSAPIPVCAGVAFAMVFVAMNRPGATSHEDEYPFQDWGNNGPTTTLDLAPIESPGRLLARLAVADAERLGTAVRVSFLFATYGDKPLLDRATLIVPSLGVCFASASGAKLENNQLLSFEPAADCAPAKDESVGAVLDVKLTSPGRVALWSYVETPSARLKLLSAARGGETILPIMRAKTPGGPPMTAGTLLGVTWARIAKDPVLGLSPFAWILLASALAVGFGVFLIQPADQSKRRLSLGLLLLGLGLSLAFVVLVPPFQSPDEPDHIMTEAAFADRPALADDARKFAQATHFERIKFRPDQKFTSFDVGKPLPVPFMPEVSEMDLTYRSPGQMAFWRFLLPRWEIGDAVGEVLKFRLLAVGFITAVLAIMTFAAAFARQSPYPLFLTVFHAPFVVFVTMTPGNYLGVGLGAMLLAGAFALSLGDRSPREAFASSFCAGLGSAILIISGSAGLVAPSALAVYLPFLLLVDAVDVESRRRFLRIWALRLLGLAAGFLPIYVWMGMASDWFVEPTFRAKFVERWIEVRDHTPFWVPLVVVASWVAFGKVMASRPQLVRWLRVPFVLAFVWVLTFPLIRTLKGVPGIEYASHGVPASEYVRLVLRSVFTSMMPTSDMDMLVGQSFWSGFGWLDVIVPGWQTGWQRFGAAALLCWGLLRPDWAERGLRSFLWLGALTSQIALTAVTAYGYWTQNYNVHGRYLIACYLILLALLFAQFPRDARVFRVAVGGLILVHGGVFAFLVERYFA